jgi:nucleoside-diphosphate-sugar epimerase
MNPGDRTFTGDGPSVSGAEETGPSLDVLGEVIITGGAGFLGRYLAHALATSGRKVTVLDDLSCSNSTFDCVPLRHGGIRCVKGSVFDRGLMDALIAEHKTVVHFASVVGVQETISHPLRTTRNIDGTLNVVNALTPHHIALFASSADVYGAHSHIYDRAMREDDYFLFQNAAVNRWVYPHVKALEETLIANSAARSVVIRVFNTYGPDMDFPEPKRVVPHFIDRVLAKDSLMLSGDGMQRRSFCYVDDMIRGMVLALAHAAAQAAPFSRCFNLGSATPITIRELAEQIVKVAVELGLLDEPYPIRPHGFQYSQDFDDSWSRVPDITRAKESFGFSPRVSLLEGLRVTLAYYRDRLETPGTTNRSRGTLEAGLEP